MRGGVAALVAVCSVRSVGRRTECDPAWLGTPPPGHLYDYQKKGDTREAVRMIIKTKGIGDEGSFVEGSFVEEPGPLSALRGKRDGQAVVK